MKSKEWGVKHICILVHFYFERFRSIYNSSNFCSKIIHSNYPCRWNFCEDDTCNIIYDTVASHCCHSFIPYINKLAKLKSEYIVNCCTSIKSKSCIIFKIIIIYNNRDVSLIWMTCVIIIIIQDCGRHSV